MISGNLTNSLINSKKKSSLNNFVKKEKNISSSDKFDGVDDSKFVKDGMLNYELLKIYEHEIIKADALLQIFKLEKGKRGNFIYNIKSEANLPYAKESIENAKKFISIIKGLTGF
jgi:hypothetical protein